MTHGPAYYNEFNKEAAAWLRELIAAGHIAPGIVDERSIEDVHPNDLRGFTQCHFFAGIGVWSYALRRAGWPDDRPVWTGSCPCQPFSAAGAGAGFDDERHLWPDFHHLIRECKPAAILGEQVASKDADPWVDLVCTDMEALGYAFGAVPFPSAGVGAPHIRDRTYWVAHAELQQRSNGQRAIRAINEARGRKQGSATIAGLCDVDRMANANQHGRGALPISGRDDSQRDAEPCSEPIGVGDTASQRSQRSESGGQRTDAQRAPIERAGEAGRLADSLGGQHLGGFARPDQWAMASSDGAMQAAPGPAGPVNGLWRDADWLFCRDGKWRPVEPGTFPLAHGAPARVGRLRGYGNAINAEAARVFIEAVMESL